MRSLDFPTALNRPSAPRYPPRAARGLLDRTLSGALLAGIATYGCTLAVENNDVCLYGYPLASGAAVAFITSLEETPNSTAIVLGTLLGAIPGYVLLNREPDIPFVAFLLVYFGAPPFGASLGQHLGGPSIDR